MRIVSIGFFAAEYLISLANAIAKDNDVILFLSQQNLAMHFPNCSDLKSMLLERQFVDSKINLRIIDYPNGHYLQKLKIIRDLIHEISDIQPDVIHYQSGGDPWIPLAMPFLQKYPLVSTIHDALAHPGASTSFISQAIKNFLVLQLSHQIIVHGKQQADILMDKYHTTKDAINVIPLGGYDLFAAFSPDQVIPESRTVLFFGALRENKGIDILLRSAPLIINQIPDVLFLIAGSGNCPAVRLMAEQYPNRFEIHNHFITAAEVHTFFERASLVVLPYTEGSQSGVLPLAYMFSRPVVATRVGSLAEVIEDQKTGFLIEPGDEHALAEAIIELLKNDLLCKMMGREGKKKLEKELSWNLISAKTLNVYKLAENNMKIAQKLARIA